MHPHSTRNQRITRAMIFGALIVGLSGPETPVGYAADKENKEAPMPATIQDNMRVKFEYTLTVDGKVVESSVGRTPLEYVQGRGQIIPGLERQLAGLQAGETKEILVAPEDAYGPVDPTAYTEVPKRELPPQPAPAIGMVLSGRKPDGRSFRATISEVKADTVMLNLNHPLAGKILHFSVKVLAVSPSTGSQ